MHGCEPSLTVGLAPAQSKGPSTVEINRGNVVAQAAAKVSDLCMIGMDRIGLQRGAIAENSDQARVVRARQTKGVEAYRKTLDSRNDAADGSQAGDMLFAGSHRNISAVFPNENVCQHNS